MWNWESLGSVSASPPSIVRWGESGQTRFVFAVGTDLALRYREFNGTAWGTWQSLGATFTSPPSATESFSPHSVNVVTLDTHHTVQYVSYWVE